MFVVVFLFYVEDCGYVGDAASAKEGTRVAFCVCSAREWEWLRYVHVRFSVWAEVNAVYNVVCVDALC